MGERTKYEPGTFSWIDLVTTDPDGAKSFYAGLFGWEFEDLPTNGAGTYTMCRIQAKDVAALARQSDQEREQGIPAHWNNYITVHDIDERAPRIPELCGNLIMPPFDVMAAGRMALAIDPTGAVFALWEPRDHIGAAIVNEPGTLTWNELATKDVDAAKRFYGELLGWTYDEIDMDGTGVYTIIKNGGRSNGGIRVQGPQEEGVRPHWLPYFGVVSCDESAAQAQKVGGTVLLPTVRVPAGGFAVVADPQGAVFAIFEGEFDD